MNNKQYRVGFTILLLFLAGCVSTSSNETEKWAPEKRAQAHVNLGLTYLRENQYDTAAAAFEYAIETDPQSDAAYHAKGLLLSKIKNHTEATKYFAKAVELDPENFLATNDYAIHLCQQGQSKLGIKVLSRIENIAVNNRLLGTQLGLGICYLTNKEMIQADQYLRAVLEREPSLPQALLPMAEVSYHRKKYLSARAFLERYFGAGAVSEKSLFLATNVEFRLGDMNKANQYRGELNRRFPGSQYDDSLSLLLK